MLARIIFGMVKFAARKGLAGPADSSSPSGARGRARQVGIRGETFAYWYLRRHGYIFIARNYTSPGLKGEIDLIGFDGPVLAFIEVKTRTSSSPQFGRPEDAVDFEKRGHLMQMARRFLADRRIREAQCRFDILAIECSPGLPPAVRLHKAAFGG